jgi:hypothetical protein
MDRPSCPKSFLHGETLNFASTRRTNAFKGEICVAPFVLPLALSPLFGHFHFETDLEKCAPSRAAANALGLLGWRFSLGQHGGRARERRKIGRHESAHDCRCYARFFHLESLVFGDLLKGQ